MFGKLAFHWFNLQDRFAKALSCCQDLPPSNSSELWACYRLGLYDTVANSQCVEGHWRADVARAVSLAACGRYDEAAAVTRALLVGRDLGRFRVMLADALAPFAPELALEGAERGGAPVALHTALLLRMGQHESAAAILRHALAGGKGPHKPELHLLSANAVLGSPAQQLASMNAFLTAHGLSPVSLRDQSLPPSPMNLQTAASLPPVHGPLVSVLMTAFRSARRIGPAVQSLLAQTYQDVEVIVVDDASDDDSADVVRAIAARDARVKYFRLPCNVGTYVAKSIGLRHASGEFVTCHDSDDWSHPLRIELQVRPLLKSKRLVFTTSQWVRMQDDGIYYARPVHPLMRLNPASPLFRREAVLAQAGGWDPVRTGADSEFHARLKLVFGRGALKRVVLPLAFGAHRPESLMTATDTGYCAAGMSPVRLAYWEAWGHWHINELRAGCRPYLAVDLLAERKFAAPDVILVPRERIHQCLQQFCRDVQ